MQWARRSPVVFAFYNLVTWGMGLPLGLLATVGFLWAGWKMLKGNWGKLALLWGWTGLYFAWQAPTFNPTMRYFLPIYPTLTILAAWLVNEIYHWGRNLSAERASNPLSRLWLFVQKRSAWLAWLVGGVVLISTFVYGFAFLSIYLRPNEPKFFG